jgi:hypothetical protein
MMEESREAYSLSIMSEKGRKDRQIACILERRTLNRRYKITPIINLNQAEKFNK